MKFLTIFFMIMFSINLLAKDDRPTGIYNGVYHIGSHSSSTFNANFKAARIAWNNICKNQMIDQLNFSKHFAEMFSSIYLNSPEVKGIKNISKQIDKQMRQSCKQKGSLNFKVQNCFESCHKSYPQKRSFWKTNFSPSMSVLCTASCQSIAKEIQNYHDTTANLMDDPNFISSTCKHNSAVNQKPRKTVKKVDVLSNEIQEILEKSVQQ